METDTAPRTDYRQAARYTEASVDKLLAEHGIRYAPSYVGQTKRDGGTPNTKPWDCDAWRVKFGTISGPNKAYETDFYTGLGLRTKKSYGNKPQAPKAATVLHSLLLDAEACNESFSNWCDNFGHDSDSIKALNIYKACEEIGHKLNKLFPRKLQNQLRELLQDY